MGSLGTARHATRSIGTAASATHAGRQLTQNLELCGTSKCTAQRRVALELWCSLKAGRAWRVRGCSGLPLSRRQHQGLALPKGSHSGAATLKRDRSRELHGQDTTHRRLLNTACRVAAARSHSRRSWIDRQRRIACVTHVATVSGLAWSLAWCGIQEPTLVRAAEL